MSEQTNKESEKDKATEPEVQIREISSILDLDRTIEALNRLDFKSAIELCSQVSKSLDRYYLYTKADPRLSSLFSL